MFGALIRIRAMIGIFALLVASAPAHPVRAEHDLKSLFHNYNWACRWANITKQHFMNRVKQAENAIKHAEDNDCFGSIKPDQCNQILHDLLRAQKGVKSAAWDYRHGRDYCKSTTEAYTQALTEIALTKWLTEPQEKLKDFEAKTRKDLKSARRKAAKKKKSTRKSKSVRDPNEFKHSTSASNASAMVIIGIVGGYLGSKSSRKKSRRAPSGGGGGRSGGHHHAGSGYN